MRTKRVPTLLLVLLLVLVVLVNSVVAGSVETRTVHRGNNSQDEKDLRSVVGDSNQNNTQIARRARKERRDVVHSNQHKKRRSRKLSGRASSAPVPVPRPVPSTGEYSGSTQATGSPTRAQKSSKSSPQPFAATDFSPSYYRGGTMVYSDGNLIFIEAETDAPTGQDDIGTPYEPEKVQVDSSNSNNNNSNNNNTFNGIDCSRFAHLEDAPPGCDPNFEQEPDEGIISPPETPPPVVDVSSPDNMPDIANLVSVYVSVGLSNHVNDMHLMTEVVAATMTRVLDTMTPFDCLYWEKDISGLRHLQSFSSSPKELIWIPNSESKHIPSATSLMVSMGSTTPATSGMLYLSDAPELDPKNFSHVPLLGDRSLGDSDDEEKGDDDDESDDEDSDNNDLNYKPDVDLLHAWTWADPIQHLQNNSVHVDIDMDMGIVWYLVRVDYGAFFPPRREDGSPKIMRKPEHIGNVTWLCQLTVNQTVHSGLFASVLGEVADEMVDLEVDGEAGGSFSDDGEDDADGGPTSPVSQEQNVLDFVGVAVVGDEDRVTKLLMDVSFKKPLSLVWGTREWFGLGLCTITTFLAFLFVLCAACLERRQAEKHAWGAFFTEPGISDVLNVGWRYHEDDREGGSGRLFLQVFDKAKIGYNDNDSVLQGGIERATVAATTVPTSARTSIGTNVPCGLSNGSDRDQDSYLPSTTFSLSTPEQRSHQYDQDSDEVR